MSEPSLSKLEPAVEPFTYRAVSLLAVSGFLLSAVFAVLVLLFAVAAFYQGTPLLMERWFLAMPAAGLVLSLVGLRRVRKSEGTLTGERVAQWGVWLSIVGGLGYLAYDFGTGYAIQYQAYSFLSDINDKAPLDSGFVRHIQNGDLESAFLLTIPYADRSQVNVRNEQQLRMLYGKPTKLHPRGELQEFKEHEFVYAVRHAPEKPTFLGIRSWEFRRGGYLVDCVFLIESPEVVMHAVVRVQSVESSAAGTGRKWHVVWPVQIVEAESRWTDLGKHLQELRDAARSFAENWFTQQSGGKTAPEDRTVWDRIEVPDERQRDAIRNEIIQFFRGKGTAANQIRPLSSRLAPWKRVDGRLEIAESFLLPVQVDPRGPMPGSMAEGRLYLQTVGKLDPQTSSGPAQWRLAAFEIVAVRGMPMPEKAEFGPPGE